MQKIKKIKCVVNGKLCNAIIINFIMAVITVKMEEMVAGADFGIKKSWITL